MQPSVLNYTSVPLSGISSRSTTRLLHFATLFVPRITSDMHNATPLVTYCTPQMHSIPPLVMYVTTDMHNVPPLVTYVIKAYFQQKVAVLACF